MTKAFGYVCESPEIAFDKNHSIDAQKLRVQSHFERYLEDKGVELQPIFEESPIVPAFKLDLIARPEGRKIFAQAKPGDHLIIDMPLRIWRGNPQSLAILIRHIEKLGIILHVADFGGTPLIRGTDTGDAVANAIDQLSFITSGDITKRKRKVAHEKRKNGLPSNSIVPGTRVQTWWGGKKGQKNGGLQSRLIWNDKQRAIMQRILELADEKEASVWKARREIEAFLAETEGREPRDVRAYRRYASGTRCLWAKLYRYEAAYRYLDIKQPSEIPRRLIILIASKQHQRLVFERTGYPEGRPEKLKIPVFTPEQIRADNVDWFQLYPSLKRTDWC